MVLRDYQLQAVNAASHEIGRGNTRVVLVSPTGSGKTVVALEIVRRILRKNLRALFLAHTEEILGQTSRKLDSLGIDHGVIQADHWRRRPECPVQLVSIPTLVRRLGNRRPDADILIVDEAHHSMSRSWRAVFEAYPTAWIVGLTATPYRGDGQGLGDIFKSLVVVAQISELIERGFLVRPRVWGCPESARPDLRGVETVAGEFNRKQLGEAMDRPKLVGDIVSHWEELASRGPDGGPRCTVVFATRIEHSQHLVERFLARGHAAEHLDGKTPGDDRRAILGRLASGETTILSVVGMLGEGYDLPRLSCMVDARPTMSRGLHRQHAGRVLRAYCDTCDGLQPECTSPGHKRDALVIDHAGNTLRHGFVDEPETYSLTGREKRTRDEKPKSVRQCASCFAIFSAKLDVCPACGAAVIAKAVAPPREAEGKLEELRPTPAQAYAAKADDRERIRLLAKWTAEGREKGWKPGAPGARFKGMFGRWPTPGESREAGAIGFPRYLVTNGACRECGGTAFGLESRSGSVVVCSACSHQGPSIPFESPFEPAADRWFAARYQADIQLGRVPVKTCTSCMADFPSNGTSPRCPTCRVESQLRRAGVTP